VGSVTAACLAEEGHVVVGADPDATKVDAIRDHRSPIVEPGLDELIAAGSAGRRLSAIRSTAQALEGTDASIVCVGTPSSAHGGLDLRCLERVATEIGGWLRTADGYHLVVVRSTTVPGTVHGSVIPTLERESGRVAGRDFGVAVCPEFLREGSGVADFRDPAIAVIGADDSRAAAVAQALLGAPGRPNHVVAIRVAEAVKYASNAFHAAKITFANELGRVLRPVGVDARDVMRVFVDDDRLNISAAYLRPGFAFGGACLPKDLRALVALARTGNQDVPMLESLLESNDRHRREAVQAIIETDARSVALFGLSFKAGTDDLRESPSVDLAEILLGKGFELLIYDRNISPERLFGTNRDYVTTRLPHLQHLLCATPDDALRGAECAVVATSDDTVEEALLRCRPRSVIDVCGTLSRRIETLEGYRGLAW
jgi:GDP-mannose 6-dehydrogenase